MVKTNSPSSNGGEAGVCRDFLRNVCRRGNKCKFAHPDQAEIKPDIVFCHDYQNKMCVRSNCKFVHCSKEDEEYYHETGNLPPGLEDVAAKKSRMLDGADGEVPVCRDYLKGNCSRGSQCKYRHLSRGDVEYEERSRRRYARPFPPGLPDRYANEYEHDRYRRWADHSDYEDFDRMDRDRLRDRERGPPHRPTRDMRDLEEENALLRRKNEELRKTVADLTSTNDVLLEQNARLRALRAEATSAVLQAETHLVNSTATAAPLLSQGLNMAM